MYLALRDLIHFEWISEFIINLEHVIFEFDNNNTV